VTPEGKITGVHCLEKGVMLRIWMQLESLKLATTTDPPSHPFIDTRSQTFGSKGLATQSFMRKITGLGRPDGVGTPDGVLMDEKRARFCFCKSKDKRVQRASSKYVMAALVNEEDVVGRS